MERKTIIHVVIAGSLFMNTACAVTMPLDANMRIDTKGLGYSQRDMALNRADMLDKLENEPENQDRIKSARALSMGGTVLSAIGGAAIGWPLGEYMTGDRHPMWWMAGAGAGLFLLGGLPLALASDAQVAKAVDVHNKLVDAREAQSKKESQNKAATIVQEKPLAPLPEGFGFDMEQGPEQTAVLCRALGYEWSENEGMFFCSGVPSSEIENASAEFAFADQHLTMLRIFVHPMDNAGSWVNALRKVETTLARMYGSPKERDFSMPSECTGKAFMDCVRSGKIKGHALWLKNERSALMMIDNTSSAPMIVIKLDRVGGVALK